MELDFDKEMNALISQMAKADISASDNGSNVRSSHLDADEISAFAENALPEKARRKYTEHLANCDPCRKSLSELVLLNAEVPVEAAEVVEIRTVEASVPWYRKLFVFPGIAYTMGGFLLIFAGFTAFIVLQSYRSGGSELVQNTAPAKSNSGRPANVNTAAANTNADAAANAAPEFGDVAAKREETLPSVAQDERTRDSGPLPGKIPSVEPVESDSSESRKDRDMGIDGMVADKGAQPLSKDDVPADAKVIAGSEVAELSNVPAKPSASGSATSNAGRAKKEKVLVTRGGEDEEENDFGTALKRAADSRNVAGKTFNRRNGVWYDTAYENQKTTNVRRGTIEYRRLDAGLRATADKFTEPVVIIWQEKAYRIQ